MKMRNEATNTTIMKTCIVGTTTIPIEGCNVSNSTTPREMCDVSSGPDVVETGNVVDALMGKGGKEYCVGRGNGKKIEAVASIRGKNGHRKGVKIF